ncbi:MAG: 50S ribosomal protein L29 [Rickettsiaceae bacterium]|nr:50S ribosomal protein L29 [Rickettsiaceae bacterium]
MSKRTSNKISSLILDDIKNTIYQKKKDLLALRFKLKLGELSDTSGFKVAKKEIARMFTILNQKQQKN